MTGKDIDDELAYGDYNQGKSSSGGKSFVGSLYRSFTGKDENKKPAEEQEAQSPKEQIQGYANSLFDKVHSSVHQLGSDISSKLAGQADIHSHTHIAGECSDGSHSHSAHRYRSYAPQRTGNDIKWYVDGCSYMWAVSKAIESARESIWILDWWLSPELFLRRPPAKFGEYRLDRMLEAAASRGVKVKVIIYKEVTQALTRKLLKPVLPNLLHSLLPESTDTITRWLTKAGLDAVIRSLEEIENDDPLIPSPTTVSSAHTKHHLERLHPNISVFRHPDHLPDRKVLQSDILSSFQNMKLNASTLSSLPGDALNGIYGVGEGSILYWAHHEKLCLIDGRTAFMGGLDLCYGRWDTYQHSIADAHPGDLGNIIFPGQDFNNARIMDFQDVRHWEHNKLDRTKSSRMGWTDVALCLTGPTTEDLKAHFVERWNMIYDEKYRTRSDERYKRLHYMPTSTGVVGEYSQPVHHHHGPDFIGHRREGQEKGEDLYGKEGDGDRGLVHGEDGGFRDQVKHILHEGKEIIEDEIAQRHAHANTATQIGPNSGALCQLTRSCSKWSHGSKIEHSIANAYIDIIKNSQHFVYIENQFFITATSEQQKPVKNKIGRAIVDRIVRAYRAGQKYKVFVLIPAVPGFAGDLKSDDALGTRAIMEFQYFSINRGGYSIMEMIAKEGINPTDYIRFYNLRNYDRINSSAAMSEAEKRSGVSYEKAREQYDQKFDASQPTELPASLSVNQPQGSGASGDRSGDAYQQYQQGAAQAQGGSGQMKKQWDSVAECYMLNGTDIRNVPWDNGNVNEIDAFVSEELYIHSKVLIADDRIVVCGSANLNDRSQLGNHDSEIAILIEDPVLVDSRMNGQPWKASRFAASLRRYIFRKHLGLVAPQDPARPDENYEPAGTPNAYDWGSEPDRLVADPLSEEFLALWCGRARANTEAFHRVFRPVPSDHVRNWREYDEYYTRYFGVLDSAGGSATASATGGVSGALAGNYTGTSATSAATGTGVAPSMEPTKPTKSSSSGGLSSITNFSTSSGFTSSNSYNNNNNNNNNDSNKNNKNNPPAEKPKARYEWGHVVAEQFSPGAEGAREVKEILSTVRGTLVEMPLLFLKDEDIAKEGLGLNAFTEEVYT